MPLFHGLVAFPITPMDPHGRVDTAALRKLVRRLAQAGVDSIGLLGSTGTYPYLSRLERRRALDAALDETGSKIPIMVGVGALRTDEAIKLAQDAEAAGAQAGLLAPVSYIPLTEDEVFGHFEAVASSGTLPICIYNNPATTHFTLSSELVARLSHLPNIVAVKNPAVDEAAVPGEIAELRRMAARGFSLGYSVDPHAAEAMIAGGDAWYSVLAGLFPQVCMDICRAVETGEHEQARQLNRRLAPLWALFRTFSSLRVIYAAAGAIGLCDTAPPAPILPLSPAAHRQVVETFGELGLDC